MPQDRRVATESALGPAGASVALPVENPVQVESGLHVSICFILLLIGLYLVGGSALKLSQWQVSPTENPALAEANAWRSGRLNLESRIRDTALVDGRIYNVYPPLFTFISFIAVGIGQWMGLPSGTFYGPWYAMLIAFPLPFVGFWAFQQVLRRAAWSAMLTGYWLIATSMLPALALCRTGSINHIHHVLSGIGLMLMAGDMLGKRRGWPAAIGILIAVWSRQAALVYAVAAVWIIWRHRPESRGRIAIVCAATVVSVGMLLTLNDVKFGSPLNSGYADIYHNRPSNDYYAQRARQYGFLSPHFVPENAWIMNLAPPRFRLTPDWVCVPDNGPEGASVWMTTPLLLLVPVSLGWWLRRCPERAFILASLPVIAATLAYHNPGSPQPGYFRFALDFIPIWLLAIAPRAIANGWRYATLACLGWGAMYFHLISN